MDATVLPNKQLLRFGCAPHCAALLLGLLSGATAQWPLEQLIKFTFPQSMAYSFRVMDHLGGSAWHFLLSESLLFTSSFS
jgi:hypothetical protein